MNSYIESIGIKLPDKKLSSKEIVDKMSISPKIKLQLITGIKERRICSGEEDSYSLASEAALDCLNYSTLKASEIEMVIFCSISKTDKDIRYFFEPAVSSIIKYTIGADEAINFDVSNACAGMLTGVDIAAEYIGGGIVKNCMVVSGEYISPICINAIKSIDNHFSSEMASLTVGDAGAAVIIKATKNKNGFEVLKLRTLSEYSTLCTAKLSEKYPGAQMFTQMKSMQKAALTEAPKFVEACLKEKGLQYNEIDFMIPHQTAKRTIQAGEECFNEHFGTSLKEIFINLESNGNTASTTHFLALYQLLKEKRFRKGDRILLLGLASGLIMGAIVFKVDELIDKYG